MASKLLSFLLLALAASASAAGPVTITGPCAVNKVLGQFPKFSTLNKLLVQTNVAADIDSHGTVTLLAVADAAFASDVVGLPDAALWKVLSLHVVLDYYDIDKISNLPNATAHLTTLFQGSGEAVGNAGFLNATDIGDGQVKLGSASDDVLVSDVIREIAMQPYNISVIEVSQLIVPPGIASGPPAAAAPKASTPMPKASTVAPAPSSALPAAGVPEAAAASVAPSTEDAAGPAVPAAEEKKASSASRVFVGAGIGAALFAAAAL